MQTMFLQMKSIAKKLKGKKFEVVRTDLEAPVPEHSIELWRKRGLQPHEKGIAEVRFKGNDKTYIYPLFFEARQPESLELSKS